jgi:NAD(P)-dependent dehydrogenase (short-subunit alcohol dehydrogenase family)
LKWLFLSSGLFLGWSLGANDAANVFGTAVATKMVRFRTAAWVAGLFVVLGSVAGVSGAAGTLGRLGAIDAPAGAFMVALAAGLAVLLLLKRIGLPVSTTQAIVGAIVGWNLHAGRPTDPAVLSRIVSSWLLCPLLSGGFAALLFVAARAAMPHMQRQRKGSIIITSSNSGVQYDRGMIAYCTTKHAVIAMTRQIAVDYAADNIRCNALCPGFVDTPFNHGFEVQMGGRAALESYVSDAIPMRRWATVDEIAAGIVYLASDQSGFMTGHALVIDGGESL